jgi:type III restriction enzyme
MALHPNFPPSPYEILSPDQRWFPAAEELRSTAYEKLLPPLVANIRENVRSWRDSGYSGASPTSRALLAWWFETAHLTEQSDSTQHEFRYYFAQREAVESVIWLYDVHATRDKFDLLRFDASGAVSANMFDEDWPRFVVKMATGAGKTKVLSLLIAWSYFHKLYEPASTLAAISSSSRPISSSSTASAPISTVSASSSTIPCSPTTAMPPAIGATISR